MKDYSGRNSVFRHKMIAANMIEGNLLSLGKWKCQEDEFSSVWQITICAHRSLPFQSLEIMGDIFFFILFYFKE